MIIFIERGTKVSKTCCSGTLEFLPVPAENKYLVDAVIAWKEALLVGPSEYLSWGSGPICHKPVEYFCNHFYKSDSPLLSTDCFVIPFGNGGKIEAFQFGG